MVNIAGGLRVSEPAADLAVALAIVSSYMDIPVLDGWTAVGEVGLGGELRAVSQPVRRANEALRLGFDSCLLPAGCGDLGKAKQTVRQAATLAEAVKAALPVPQAANR